MMTIFALVKIPATVARGFVRPRYSEITGFATGTGASAQHRFTSQKLPRISDIHVFRE